MCKKGQLRFGVGGGGGARGRGGGGLWGGGGWEGGGGGLGGGGGGLLSASHTDFVYRVLDIWIDHLAHHDLPLIKCLYCM